MDFIEYTSDIYIDVYNAEVWLLEFIYVYEVVDYEVKMQEDRKLVMNNWFISIFGR